MLVSHQEGTNNSPSCNKKEFSAQNYAKLSTPSAPYGIVPKEKYSMSNLDEKQVQKEPFSLSFTTSHFFSLVHGYLKSFKNQHNDKNQSFVKKHKGLMPHTPTKTIDAYITPQTVTSAPIKIADNDDSEDYMYLGSSNESNLSSSWSSQGSSFDQRSHRSSISSMTLSNILCDYYVQTQKNHQDNNSDVPLETYKMFEASYPSYCRSGSNADDDDESWFIGDNFQKTREWIQVVVDEELQLSTEKTAEASSTIEIKTRSLRTNPAHLRMIIAEVNMMRSNKIVGPLKPRGFLAARTDIFKPCLPSPLKKTFSSC